MEEQKYNRNAELHPIEKLQLLNMYSAPRLTLTLIPPPGLQNDREEVFAIRKGCLFCGQGPLDCWLVRKVKIVLILREAFREKKKKAAAAAAAVWVRTIFAKVNVIPLI